MSSFFRELKRRNVYKVAVGYAVVAWLAVQIAATILPMFHAPEGLLQGFVILVALGFPVALVVAWAFEMTPDGMKRTESVAPEQSLPQWSRRKFAFFVAGTALVATALLAAQLLRHRPAPPAAVVPPALAKSIAVLPFENRSEEQANAFFADGIQDEILTRLARIADLKVISRTSTQRYKSSPDNLPEIARQLGVEHVLEGSVQKIGAKVRVSVQLIRGTSDAHVWAETYDRELTDIFAVESEIAGAIARALQARLTPNEQSAVAAKPTNNPEAYEAYLRGRAVWNKLASGTEDYDEMVRHFSEAVKLDPQFALAWSFLSVAHSNQYWAFKSAPALAEEAKAALGEAKRLQPGSSETHFAEGMYDYKVLGDYEAALRAFAVVREISANSTAAIEFSAYVKRRQGKWDEAIRLHEESLEIDPRNPIILSEAALTYRALRRFTEAAVLVDRAREIEPENPQLLAQRAEISLAQGDAVTAERLLNAVPLVNDDPETTMALVRFYTIERRYPEAIRALQRTLAQPEKLPAAFPTLAAHYRAELALVEALAGEPTARASLDRAQTEMTAVQHEHDVTDWSRTLLLLVAAFRQDKATVDAVAAELAPHIRSDAFTASGLRETIAVGRARLGETEAALALLEELLQVPGSTCITPVLLRLDPGWDPLRSDPRFQKLAEAHPIVPPGIR